MASNKENIQSFNHKLYTVGIEEEYMICDTKSGDLINKANQIMSSLKGELKNRFSYELIQSEIESNTPICSSVNESILEVLKLRNYLKDLGEKYGYRIGMSGTHPTALPANQKFIDNDSYNWVKSNLTYYASRNITFSNHFHIAVENLDEAVRDASKHGFKEDTLGHVRLSLRDGKDTFIEVAVYFIDAVLGNSIQVPCIDGSKAKMNLSAGTQSGTRL